MPSDKTLSSEEKQVLQDQKRKDDEQRKADIVRIAKEALKVSCSTIQPQRHTLNCHVGEA